MGSSLLSLLLDFSLDDLQLAGITFLPLLYFPISLLRFSYIRPVIVKKIYVYFTKHFLRPGLLYSASEQGISNYATVFPNEMLLEMAANLPTTREELLAVPQCTEYKLARFDADARFLEITLNYLSILGGECFFRSDDFILIGNVQVLNVGTEFDCLNVFGSVLRIPSIRPF